MEGYLLMKNTTVRHFLQNIANDALLISTSAKDMQNNISVLLGYLTPDDLNAVIPSYPIVSNGFDESLHVLKEIKKMIVELKIKGSVRQRDDGRFEYRSALLGSIYGFTKEELELKITKRLKEAKK